MAKTTRGIDLLSRELRAIIKHKLTFGALPVWASPLKAVVRMKRPKAMKIIIALKK